MILFPRALAFVLCLGAAGTAASVTLASSHASGQSMPPQQITVVDTATGHGSNGYTGTFTASGLVCPTGTWADDETTVAIFTTHTCGDGSGAIGSKLYASSGGVWTLAAGTGPYTTLRGRGQCHVDEGPPVVRTCQFLAAFDNVAPSATITRFTASPAHGHTYRLKISFVATDDVAGNAVVFKLTIGAGSRTLATRQGTTTGQATAFPLTVKPPKAARKLTMKLTLADPVENTRTIVRATRLPGRQ